MSRNYDYTAGNLLDYLYHQNCYKLIGIDLSRQANTDIPQNINFAEKQQKTVLKFSLDLLIVTE